MKGLERFEDTQCSIPKLDGSGGELWEGASLLVHVLTSVYSGLAHFEEPDWAGFLCN